MKEEKGNVLPIGIEGEMKKSYMDYAMSVIVGRALPRVEDGLKPVHRRILFAMKELGFTPDKAYRKSARIVGDVLGKYHPHGDTAVYDAMVRMSQDFSTRYELIDGHGNFGSIDGDSAAAMRYTEAKLTKLSLEMTRDIDKETVSYSYNFDDTLKEPDVLPSRYPNLLVNGSNGIAVGMATSIPPHNLDEVIGGVINYIDNPEISLEELMESIQGPDFPTGSTIMGRESIKEAYRTGRGRVVVRAQSVIEEMANNKSRIVVDEIPYQVNKAKMIERIADLVKDKKIEGISDLRDESNREGIRVVIELKRDVNPNVVLNKLYKHTQMQDTFSIIMIALVDGQPKLLNLQGLIYHYVNHQKTIIRKRTEFDLRKAEARAHILEGLKIALDHLDEVIKLIRASQSPQKAKEELMERFDLSEKQSTAILEMRLQKLTGLERDKVESEYREVKALIDELKAILASEQRILDIIKEELLEIKEQFGDPRRTKIMEDPTEFKMEDMIEKEDVVITLTHFGYIKRLPVDTYKSQKRGGKGISALTTREEDFVERMIVTSSHDYLFVFTNKGKVYQINVYEIPEAKRQAKGTAIINLLQLEPSEKIAAVIPMKRVNDYKHLFMATKKGLIKKTKLSHFKNSRKSGLTAIKFKDDDELISVRYGNDQDEMMLITAQGKSIRFPQSDIRELGRSAMGVRGIRLTSEDEVVSMQILKEDKTLLLVSEKGYGKRTELSEYRIQGRGGKGIKTYRITDKTGDVVGARLVKEDEEALVITNDGAMIRFSISEVSKTGRDTSGVRLIRTDENNHIVSLAIMPKEEDPEDDME
ncbi:DNA gyrase subunit A [Isachenkonia alkalipeptolytica]|uniref:DNA gyrase subunit A n=2 Tax=Bacteria TaxID=2 RepID=A0AA44BEQ9_9CLOT|nr:DNA gyrase subunit A [Isachenkonia alkalipeptolytica]NBG89233.1 DNA gyrase subunit A [Isachenkonia alkalipeptolytica]